MATILQSFYYTLRRGFSRPGEKGMRHAGYWQELARGQALRMCRSAQGRLLEVGAGEGLFCAALLEKNPDVEVWGLDNGGEESPATMRRVLAEKYPGRMHFVEGHAEHLSFENDFFDTVVMINLFICMKGLREVRTALGEARRVLKPGGRLVIEFRNEASALLRLKYKFAKHYDGTLEGHPLSVYRVEEMRPALAEADFDIEAEFFMGAPWKAWAPIVMMEAKKRG